jgi:transcription antitermination factor NusG
MDQSLWHILRVTPNAELAVSLLLNGYTTYVPSVTKRSFNRRLRVWSERTAPIFPGMVFVEVPAPSSLRVAPSNSIRGFYRNSDRVPLVLKPRDIETLRRVELEASRLIPVEKSHQFHEGDSVEFLDGVYKDFRAVVRKLAGANGLVVELEGLFGNRFGVMKTLAANVRAVKAA